ncbi:MAG TPA: zinc ribbon domain-containing protein [Candidatus Onthomonas avicola]|nr:zinc ribbon domain-containing protein [Candidatus Onthomonas avicola]
MEDEKRCPHCNAPLEGSEEVCPNCGREIPSAEWLNVRPTKAGKVISWGLFWVCVAAAIFFLLVLGDPVSGCVMAVVAAIICPAVREAYKGYSKRGKSSQPYPTTDRYPIDFNKMEKKKEESSAVEENRERKRRRSGIPAIMAGISLFFTGYHVVSLAGVASNLSGNIFGAIVINLIGLHIVLSVAAACLCIAVIVSRNQWASLAAAICSAGAALTFSGGQLDMIVAAVIMIVNFIYLARHDTVRSGKNADGIQAFRCPRCNAPLNEDAKECFNCHLPIQRGNRKKGGDEVVLIIAVVVLCIAVIGYSSREEDAEVPQSSGAETEPVNSSEVSDDAVAQEESAEDVAEDTEEEEFIIPEPIVFSGSGDDIVDLDIPEDFGEYVFQISGNEEARHFSVISYNSQGEYSELLVNTSDPYEGVTVDASQDVARLEVKATGEWSITVTSLYSMPIVELDEVHGGTGDAVFLNAGGAGDGTAHISGNEESRHFAVTAYVLDGDVFDRELWVNTTEPYEGTVMTGGTPIIIVVDASDAWEITLNG